MGGGPFSNCDSNLHVRFESPQQLQGWKASRFSKCCSRLSAAHIRPEDLQPFQGFVRTQPVTLICGVAVLGIDVLARVVRTQHTLIRGVEVPGGAV
eukprot:8713317-Pyramimonas_sp.AAC.1